MVQGGAIRWAILLAAAAGPPAGGWGRDINPGAGPALISEARAELLRIVEAPPAERPALIEAYAAGRADGQAEAWKRFRNPELKRLFLRLLKNPEWHTAHRALFALERFEGPDILPAAWDLLFHAERRVREKAAITCIKRWSAEGAKRCSKGDWKGGLDSLLSTEKDFHVRKCLEALRARAEGRLAAQEVYEEFTVKGADGLVLTPFLEGMDKAKAVAPGYAAKGVSQAGGSSASRLPVADLWTTPVLGYGEEEVEGTSLQPFGNPREGGRVHTGQDFSACMDGSGTYAAADGIVKFVHSGSDMGTLLVLEHRLDEKGVVCAVYMHGGDTVFVKGGDRVAAGQLLGSMGMSFSLENGGHFAHLHYGLYPGPFQSNHNYGYKKAADGLGDWLDPAKCLPRWRDGNRPEADEAPEAIVGRAARLRKAGWPTRALGVLTDGAKVLKGKPGADALDGALDAWKKDPLFQKALKGEPRVEALEEARAKSVGMKDAMEKLLPAGKALLADLGDTDLAPRIREAMR